jgi:hypothetical protein
MNIDLMIKAYKLMKEASLQNHTGHWDRTGQSGKGCEECIKTTKLREEADRLFEESKR